MTAEQLRIFNEHQTPIGTAQREEAHRKGLWHETFQCWFVGEQHGEEVVYLQQRSGGKKDYPGLFDITAAGHLLSHETVQDGVREIEEELGVPVAFSELHPLGVIEDCIRTEDIHDNEFAHVFVYKADLARTVFRLQQEEVAGVCLVPLKAFADLWNGRCDSIRTTDETRRQLTRADFVPHTAAYYRTILRGITTYYQERKRESQ